MRAATKDFFREIKHTLNRYLSIMAIMALGVAFYAGIRSSEPDMRDTVKALYDAGNYCDIWCTGTMGISETGIEELKKVSPDFTVEGMYYTEVFLERETRDYQIQVYSLMEKVSKVSVTEGRLPEKDNEVFVDAFFFENNSDMKLGGQIKFYAENDISDALKYDTYTIVGYGTYPQYLSWDRGTVSIGNGKADAFVFMLPEAFKAEYYTYAHISVSGGRKYGTYSQAYKDFVAEYTDKIEAVKDKISELRLEEVKKPYLEELEDKKAELLAAEQEIASGEKAISEAAAALDASEKELKAQEDMYKYGLSLGMPADAEVEAKLKEGYAQIEAGRLTLSEQQAEINKAKETLEDGKKAIADGEKELNDMKAPDLYVLTRESIQSSVEFGMDSERIGKIGRVFPAIFFLVATFVSLTTMTRMVEEQRTQIGTYKALGYSKLKIAGKYFWYSVSASLTGGVIGAIVGSKLLPFVIMSAYKILYCHLPESVLTFRWGLSLMSIGIAVGCTVLATMAACLKVLAAVPAVLMRPEAPKAGRRIVLEHITFIWKRMSFTGKATARNLFRYKKRLFMTIFGIGGCMALLMVGFGLRDSIGDIVKKQYDNIWTYDADVSITGDVGEIVPGNEGYRDIFKNISRAMYVRNESVNVKSKTGTKEIQLFVPESLEALPEFLSLQDRKTNERYRLEKEGCVISEKLARVLKLKVGDELTVFNGDEPAGSVRVTAIAENYLYYYVYMSKDQYLGLFPECEYNKILLKFDSGISSSVEDELAAALLELPSVTSITNIASLRDRVAKMMKSLDLVIVVLIVSAGLLAFIVLYNLNNINILERRRELATIKVLGFYDTELAAYVYRENVWLTVFGVIVGCFLGFFLHKFVIETCEIDMIMFGRDIKPLSYLYSVGMTFIFAILVNFGMFFRLRKVNMVESLKSAE